MFMKEVSQVDFWIKVRHDFQSVVFFASKKSDCSERVSRFIFNSVYILVILKLLIADT